MVRDHEPAQPQARDGDRQPSGEDDSGPQLGEDPAARPPLLDGDALDAELGSSVKLPSTGHYNENNVTEVLRQTITALWEAGDLDAQRLVVEALLGDPNDGGVRTNHPARAALRAPAFSPALSGDDSPDLIVTTSAGGAGEGRAPLTGQLVIEHKPAGTKQQFSRASLLWPKGTLFAGDSVAAMYRDLSHVRAWVFGVEPGEPVDPRCVEPHGPHPTDPMRCEHGVLRLVPPKKPGRRPGRLHDHREGLNALYLSVPQIDVYRCSRAWVDEYAAKRPDTAFTLDTPADVAWVVLSGADAWTIADAWGRWAFTAPHWALTRYSWVEPRVVDAYHRAWTRAGSPGPHALPEHLRWFRLLASVLRDARRRPGSRT